MTELIKISQNEKGEQVVNAKELHKFLEVKTLYKDWIKNQIDKAMLEENIDFIKVAEKIATSGGMQNTITCILSLSSAKEIAMLNGKEKGKTARLYFIECEKRVKTSIIMTVEEMIIAQAQSVLQVKKEIAQLSNRLDVIEEDKQNAERNLLLAEKSTIELPTLSTKRKIEALVSNYYRATGVDFFNIWNSLYDNVYLTYGIKIKAHKKINPNESWLSVAERIGVLDEVFAIASAKLVF
jgi:anti-repressor protein